MTQKTADPTFTRCIVCGHDKAQKIVDVRVKPSRETNFGIPPEDYIRTVFQCARCGVFNNLQDMLSSGLYKGDYNKATYQNKMKASYDRIRGLPPEQSDNKQRVKRVMEENAARGRAPEKTWAMDVGTGLCVFLGELKDKGVHCFAVDPDRDAIQHALETVGVDDAHVGSLEDTPKTRQFDIISLNKVLEHVPDPVGLLAQVKPLLAQGGFCYIEVPDGESAHASAGAAARQEFFIEHYTVFTPKSLEYLAKAAGLKTTRVERLHEPSDKFTLYAFLSTEDHA